MGWARSKTRYSATTMELVYQKKSISWHRFEKKSISGRHAIQNPKKKYVVIAAENLCCDLGALFRVAVELHRRDFGVRSLCSVCINWGPNFFLTKSIARLRILKFCKKQVWRDQRHQKKVHREGRVSKVWKKKYSTTRAKTKFYET